MLPWYGAKTSHSQRGSNRTEGEWTCQSCSQLLEQIQGLIMPTSL